MKLNYDPRQNLGPHADSIIGSANTSSTDLVMHLLKDLSLSQFIVGQDSSVSSTPTQLVDVHSLQLSSNPNGN
jgi:hypothetical protein